MTEDQKGVILGEVEKMRHAARKMEQLAIGIAVLVVLLFGVAGLVFYYASDITGKDRKVYLTADGGSRIVNEDGEPIVADRDPQQRQFQIFTAITRFGTILLIIYANSILFNVFQYLIRTANYYRAKAHALVILPELTDKEAARYAVLAEAISVERISFGAEPATPMVQATELLKSVKE